MPALAKWQQDIIAKYAKTAIAEPLFASWHELPFATLKKLFPERRFFTNAWMERPVPGKEKEAIGLGGGEYTLICDRNGKLVSEIYHYGNYDPYGSLLAANKVSIRSPEDAKLVWDAFCDLHQKHWKDQPAIQVSDTVWHLGDKTIDRFHYYYEVRLTNEHIVESARLHADEIKKPDSK